MKTFNTRCYLLAASLMAALSSRTMGQSVTEFKIDSVTAALLPKGSFIEVFFTQPLDSAHSEDLSVSGVTVLSLPTETPLTVTRIKRLEGTPFVLEIDFSGTVPPADVQLKVTFPGTLNFMDGTTPSPVKGPFSATATLIRDAKSLQDAIKKLVDDMGKAGKSSTEKNIFASGFVTTASSGQTQGGADIHLNSLDLGIPGLKSFLNIVKTTADGSDAKNFEAGGTYRSTFLFSNAQREKIKNALADYAAASSAKKAAAGKVYSDAVGEFQKATLAAVFLDFVGKLEGEATNFNVTNGVFEASLKVQSRVKSLNAARTGYLHFQLLPAGFEGGKTLRQPDAASTTTTTPTTGTAMTATDKALQQLDGIARFKVGGTLNAFFEDKNTKGPFKRFELETGVVDRLLFLKEIHYDMATKMNDTIKDGNKPYFHADAKLFFVENTAGRYGVKVSYNRGSLPPVYAPVKSFQFGFLFESAN